MSEAMTGKLPRISSGVYVVRVCTTNLGASKGHPGDPTLPHCLVHVHDEDGRRLRSVSLGRTGLAAELNADVPSHRCEAAAVRVTEAELRRFEATLQRCADEGYAWGRRDCCSCIERAFVRGLGRPAPMPLTRAAAAIAAVPDPLLRRSSR